MNLYDKYPTIEYDYGGRKKLAIDIVKRFRIIEIADSHTPFYEEYTLNDGDSAESIAHKIYGDINLYWLVYLVNGIINPYEDWLLDRNMLTTFTENKYKGSTLFLNPTSLAHESDDFKAGEKIYFTTNTGNSYEADIVDWNRTFFRLMIENETGTFTADSGYVKNSNGKQIATVGRRTDLSHYALRHFEDEDGEMVDPIPMIQSYIAGTSSFAAVNVVSFSAYEFNKNELKRGIALVRPEYVGNIKYDLSREIAKIKKYYSQYESLVKAKSTIQRTKQIRTY